ncbi:MAG: transcriptional regulator [Puniceicoccaceae bacterium]|nr:transcriptional regulator [Puniceicoccaceae bacterium]
MEVTRGVPEVIALIWVNTTESWRHSHLAHLLIQTISERLEAQGGRLRTIYHNELEGETLPDLHDVGALFVAGAPRSDFWEKLPENAPRLNLLCKPYPTEGSFLDIDSLHTGYALTQHLLDHGHRRIAFVSNSRKHRSFNSRYLGYYRALDEYELEPQCDWVIRLSQPEDMLVETTRPTSDIELPLAEMLTLPLAFRPTAIVAANDWVAAAIYQYAHRAGVKIPEDLSVVGCDNDPGICDFLKPALTTFSISYIELANDAVDWMLSLVNGKPLLSQPVMMQFRGELIARDSVRHLSET